MNDRFEAQSRVTTDFPSATLPGTSRRPVRFSLSPSHDIVPAHGLANAQEPQNVEDIETLLFSSFINGTTLWLPKSS